MPTARGQTTATMTNEIGEPTHRSHNELPRLAIVGNERISLLTGCEESALFSDRNDFLARGVIHSRPEMILYQLHLQPEMVIAIPRDEPDYRRIQPDQLLQLLRGLPDLRLVRQVMIVDAVHRETSWIRQVTGNRGVTVHAEACKFGKVILPGSRGSC